MSQSRLHRRSTCSVRFFAIAAEALLFAYGASAAVRPEAGSPRAAMWQKLYAALPASWRSGETVAVREVTDTEMDRLVRGHGDSPANADGDDQVEGFFEFEGGRDGVPTVTLRRNLGAEHAAFVFTHEYGHFVWEELLNGRARSDYYDIWDRERRAHKLVSSYSDESVEEGFAEAFAFFLRKPDRLHARDRLSESFLIDLLPPREFAVLRGAKPRS